MGDIIYLGRVRAERRLALLDAEADAWCAIGEEGTAHALMEQARMIQEFDLGIDTGLKDLAEDDQTEPGLRAYLLEQLAQVGR